MPGRNKSGNAIIPKGLRCRIQVQAFPRKKTYGIPENEPILTHIPQNSNVVAMNRALLDFERATLFIFFISR